MSRKLPKLVIAGLTTKSAQIRALAQEDYTRAEIANLLGIKYQHVRKVLLDSGIEYGLQNESSGARLGVSVPRAVQVRPTVNTEGVRPENWPIERLLASGFERLAVCHQDGPGLFRYSARAPNCPGVYAFAVDGVVTYVGLTRGKLAQRLGHYIYGHEKQATSARVKQLILDALASGQIVEVCTAMPPELSWNGLPVDGPAGLETGLIRLIRPPWNQSA